MTQKNNFFANNESVAGDSRRWARFTKAIFGVFVLIFIVAFLFFLSYSNDYYHTDESAVDLNSEKFDNVIIEKCEDYIIFRPSDGGTEVGFIFYPGGKVEYTAYAPLMIKLAENGISCYLLNLNFNLAIMDTHAAYGICEKYPEIKNWYIGGQSLGGAVASIYLEDNADSFNGLVLCASYSNVDLSDTNLSVLSVYGENDKVINMDSYNKNKVYLPSDFSEHIIAGGCHSYFGAYGIQNDDGEPTITAEEQQDITADVITKWKWIESKQ